MISLFSVSTVIMFLYVQRWSKSMWVSPSCFQTVKDIKPLYGRWELLAILISISDKRGGKYIFGITGHLHFNDTSVKSFVRFISLGVGIFALVLQIGPCSNKWPIPHSLDKRYPGVVDCLQTCCSFSTFQARQRWSKLKWTFAQTQRWLSPIFFLFPNHRRVFTACHLQPSPDPFHFKRSVQLQRIPPGLSG